MSGRIIRKSKIYLEEADKISWSSNNGNLDLSSGKTIIMKGQKGGVKFGKR